MFRWNNVTQNVTELFIENQAFSGRIIRLLAHPLLPSLVSKLSLFLSLPVCRQVEIADWGRGGGGRGAQFYDREKAWPSINHSMLSDVTSNHCLGNFYEQRVTIGRSSHSADSETTPSRSGAGNRRQFDADPARLVFRPVLPTLAKIFRPGDWHNFWLKWWKIKFVQWFKRWHIVHVDRIAGMAKYDSSSNRL